MGGPGGLSVPNADRKRSVSPSGVVHPDRSPRKDPVVQLEEEVVAAKEVILQGSSSPLSATRAHARAPRVVGDAASSAADPSRPGTVQTGPGTRPVTAADDFLAGESRRQLVPVIKTADLAADKPVGKHVAAVCAKMTAVAKKLLGVDHAGRGTLYSAEDFVGCTWKEVDDTLVSTNDRVYFQLDPLQWLPLSALGQICQHLQHGTATPASLKRFMADSTVTQVDVHDGVKGELILEQGEEALKSLIKAARRLVLAEAPMLAGVNPLGRFNGDSVYVVGDVEAVVKAVVLQCGVRYDAGTRINHISQPMECRGKPLTDKITKEKAAVATLSGAAGVILIWANQSPALRVYQTLTTPVPDTVEGNEMWMGNLAAKDPAAAPTGQAPKGLPSFVRKARLARVPIVTSKVAAWPEEASTHSDAFPAMGIQAGAYAKYLCSVGGGRGGAEAGEGYIWRRRYANAYVHDGADLPENLFLATEQAGALLSMYDLYIQMLLGNSADGAEEGGEVHVRTEFLAPSGKGFGYSAQKAGTWWMRFAPDALRISILEGTDVKIRAVVPCGWGHPTSKYLTCLLRTLCDDEAFDRLLLESETIGAGDLKPPAERMADEAASRLLSSSQRPDAGTPAAPQGEGVAPEDDARRKRRRNAVRKIRAMQAVKNAKKDNANRRAAGGPTDGAPPPKDVGKNVPSQLSEAVGGAAVTPETASPFLAFISDEAGLNEVVAKQKKEFDGRKLAALVNVQEVMNFTDMDESDIIKFRKVMVAADPAADGYLPAPDALPEDVRVVQGHAVYWGVTCTVKSYLKFYNNGMVGHLTGLYVNEDSLLQLPSAIKGERFIFQDQPCRRGQIDLGGRLDLSHALACIDFPDGIEIDLAGSFDNAGGFDSLTPGTMPTQIVGTLDKSDNPIEIGGAGLRLKKLQVGVNFSDEVVFGEDASTRIFSINFASDAILSIAGGDPVDVSLTFAGGSRDSPQFTGKIGSWNEPFGLSGVRLEGAELSIGLKPLTVAASAVFPLNDTAKLTVSGSYSELDGAALTASIEALNFSELAKVYERITGGDPMSIKGDESSFAFKDILLVVSKQESKLDCTMTWNEYVCRAAISLGKKTGLMITGEMEGIDLGMDIKLDKVALEMCLPPGGNTEAYLEGLAGFTIPVVDMSVDLLFRLGAKGKCGAVNMKGLDFSLGKIHSSLDWLEFSFPTLLFGYADVEGLELSIADVDVTFAKGMNIHGTCSCSLINKVFGDTLELGFAFTIEGKRPGPIDIGFGAPPLGSVNPRMALGSLPMISLDHLTGTLMVSFGSNVTIFNKRVGLEGGFTIAFGPPIGVSLFGRAIVEDPGLKIGAPSSTLHLKQIGTSCSLLPIPGCLVLFGQFNFGVAASAAAVLRLHPTIHSQDAFMIEIKNCTFRDVIDLVPNLVGCAPLPKIPMEEQLKKLHWLKLSIAPVDMPPLQFGDIVMKPGICFAGDVEAFGARAFMMVEVGPTSFLLEARLRDAIELGDILKISSVDGERGPSFYLFTDKGEFELRVDGMMQLLGRKVWAKVLCKAPTTLSFDVGFSILGITTQVMGRKSDGSLVLSFEMGDAQRRRAKEKTLKEVKKAVREMMKQAEAAAGTGEELVEAYNSGLKQLEADLQTAKDNLGKLHDAMLMHSGRQIELLDQQQAAAEDDIADIETAYQSEVSSLQAEFEEALTHCKTSLQQLKKSFEKAKALREKEEMQFARDFKAASEAFKRKLDTAQSKADKLQKTQEASAKAFKIVEEADPGKCCKCSCKHKKAWERRVANAKRDLNNAKKNFQAAKKIVVDTISTWQAKERSMTSAHEKRHADLRVVEDQQLRLLGEQENLYQRLTAVVDASTLGKKLAEQTRCRQEYDNLDKRFAEQRKVLEVSATSDRKQHAMMIEQDVAQFRRLHNLHTEGTYAEVAAVDKDQAKKASKALDDLVVLTESVKPILRDEIIPCVKMLRGAMKGIGLRYAVVTRAGGGRFVPTIEEAREVVAGLEGTDRIVMGTNGCLVNDLCEFSSVAAERELVVEGMAFLNVEENFVACWTDADGAHHIEEHHLHYDAMEQSRQVAYSARARLVLDRKGKLFPAGCAAHSEADRLALLSYVYSELAIEFVVVSKAKDALEPSIQHYSTFEAANVRAKECIAAATPCLLMDGRGHVYLEHSQAPAKQHPALAGAVLQSLGMDFVLASLVTKTEVVVGTCPTFKDAVARVKGVGNTKSYLTVDSRGVEKPDATSCRSDHVKALMLAALKKQLSDNNFLICAAGVGEGDPNATSVEWFKTLGEARERSNQLARHERVLMDNRGRVYGNASSDCEGNPKFLLDAYQAIGVKWNVVKYGDAGAVDLKQYDSYAEAAAAADTSKTCVTMDTYGRVYEEGTNLRPERPPRYSPPKADVGVVSMAHGALTTAKLTFPGSLAEDPRIFYGLSSFGLENSAEGDNGRWAMIARNEWVSAEVESASVSRLGFTYEGGGSSNGGAMGWAALSDAGAVRGAFATQTVGWDPSGWDLEEFWQGAYGDYKRFYEVTLDFGKHFAAPPRVVIGMTGFWHDTREVRAAFIFEKYVEPEGHFQESGSIGLLCRVTDVTCNRCKVKTEWPDFHLPANPLPPPRTQDFNPKEYYWEGRTAKASYAYLVYPSDASGVQDGVKELEAMGSHDFNKTFRVDFPSAFDNMPKVTAVIQGFSTTYCNAEVHTTNAQDQPCFDLPALLTAVPEKRAACRAALTVENVSTTGFDLRVVGANITESMSVAWLAQSFGTPLQRNKFLTTGEKTTEVVSDLRQDVVRFSLKVKDDAHMFLHKDGTYYEIVICGWGGCKTKIKKSGGGETGYHVASGDDRLLCQGEERHFWIKFDKDTTDITFGAGLTVGAGKVRSIKTGSAEPIKSLSVSVLNTTDPSKQGDWAFELSDKTLQTAEQQKVYALAREQAEKRWIVAHLTGEATLAEPKWFKQKSEAVRHANSLTVSAATPGKLVMDVHGFVAPEGAQYHNDTAKAFLHRESRRVALNVSYHVANEDGEKVAGSARYETLEKACGDIAAIPAGSSYLLMGSAGQAYMDHSYFNDTQTEQLLWNNALKTLGAGLVLCYRDFYKIRSERFYNFSFDSAFERAKGLPGSTNRVLMDTFGNVIENASAFSDGNIVTIETHAPPPKSKVADPHLGALMDSTVTGLTQSGLAFRLRGAHSASILLGEDDKDPAEAKYHLVLAPEGHPRRMELYSGLGTALLAHATLDEDLLDARKFRDLWVARAPSRGGRLTVGTGDFIGRNVALVYEPNEADTRPLTCVALASKNTPVSWQLNIAEMRTNGFLVTTPADPRMRYSKLEGRVLGDTMRFCLKAKCNAKLAMNSVDDDGRHPLYTLRFGSEKNTVSTLRKGEDGATLATHTGALLDGAEYVEMWVKFDRLQRRLSIGTGSFVGRGEIMQTSVALTTCPFKYVFMGVEGRAAEDTDVSDGEWCFRTDTLALQTPPGIGYTNKVAATQPGQNRVRLHVKASAQRNVFIGFAQENNPERVLYEVALGAGKDDYVQLRDSQAGHWGADLMTFGKLPSKLDAECGDDFWITWSPHDKRLRVGAGRQAGAQELVSCATRLTQTPLRYIFFTTLDGEAEWQLLDDQEYITSRAELLTRTDPSFNGEEYFALDRPVQTALAKVRELGKQSAARRLKEAQGQSLGVDLKAKAKKATLFRTANPSGKAYLALRADETEGYVQHDFFDDALKQEVASWGSGVEYMIFDDAGAVMDCTCTSDAARRRTHTRFLKQALKQPARFVAAAVEVKPREGAEPDVHVETSVHWLVAEATEWAHTGHCATLPSQASGQKAAGAVVTADGCVLMTWGDKRHADTAVRRAVSAGQFIVVYRSHDASGAVESKKFVKYRDASDFLELLPEGTDHMLLNNRGRVVDHMSQFSDLAADALHLKSCEEVGGAFRLCAQRRRDVTRYDCVIAKARDSAIGHAQQLATATAMSYVTIDYAGTVCEEASRTATPAARRACVAAAKDAINFQRSDGFYVVCAEKAEQEEYWDSEVFVSYAAVMERIAALGLVDDRCSYVTMDSLGNSYRALSHVASNDEFQAAKTHCMREFDIGAVLVHGVREGFRDQRFYVLDDQRVMAALRNLPQAAPWLLMDSMGHVILCRLGDDPEGKRDAMLRGAAYTAIHTDPKLQAGDTATVEAFATELSQKHAVDDVAKRSAVHAAAPPAVTGEQRKRAADALNAILEANEVLEGVDRRILDLDGLLDEFDVLIDDDFCSDVTQLRRVLSRATHCYAAASEFNARAEQLEFLTNLTPDTLTDAVRSAITWSEAEQAAFIRLNANLVTLKHVIAHPNFDAPSRGDEFIHACRSLRGVVAQAEGLYPKARPYIQRVQKMFGQAPGQDTHLHVNTLDSEAFMPVGRLKGATLVFTVEAGHDASIAFHTKPEFAVDDKQVVLLIGGNANHETSLRCGLQETWLAFDGAAPLGMHTGVLLSAKEPTTFWVHYDAALKALNFGIGGTVGSGTLVTVPINPAAAPFPNGYVAVRTEMGATGQWAFPADMIRAVSTAGAARQAAAGAEAWAKGGLGHAHEMGSGEKKDVRETLPSMARRPKVFMGLNEMGVREDVPHRFRVSMGAVKKNEFSWTARTFNSGCHDRLGMAWLASTHPGVQVGLACGVSNPDKPLAAGDSHTQFIPFEREFDAPPAVVMGLYGADMITSGFDAAGCMLKCSEVSTEGFTVTCRASGKVPVTQATISWMAVPRALPVASGAATVPGSGKGSRWIDFETPFKSAPQMAVACTGYTVDGTQRTEWSVGTGGIHADKFELVWDIGAADLGDLCINWVALESSPPPEGVAFEMGPLEDAVSAVQDIFEFNEVREHEVVTVLLDTANALQVRAAKGKRALVSSAQLDAQRQRVERSRALLRSRYTAHNKKRRAMVAEQKRVKAKYEHDLARLLEQVRAEVKKLRHAHELLYKFLAKSEEQEDVVGEQRELQAELKNSTAAAVGDMQDYTSRLRPAQRAVDDAEKAKAAYESSALAHQVKAGVHDMKQAAHNAKKAAAIYEQMMRNASFTIGNVKATAKVAVGGDAGLDIEFAVDIDFDFSLHIDLGIFDFWIRLPKFHIDFSINFDKFIEFIKNIAKAIFEKIKEAF